MLEIKNRKLSRNSNGHNFSFELLKSFNCSISSVSIYYAPESDLGLKSYDHLNFSRASVVKFRASRYITRIYRTSEWKVMTIWISRELPLLNFESLDILCALIRHSSEKLWEFEFLESFRRSISSVSIHYIAESDIRVKRYDHLNSRELPLFNFEHLDILRAFIGHPNEKLWSFEFLESFRCSTLSVLIYYVP